MDHQVHHDRVLLDARLEGAEPARLDEERPLDDLLELLYRTVEPFDVADVEDGAGAARDHKQLTRLLECRRDRLLQEHADTCLEEVARDLEVLLGRHRDAHEVDPADQVAVVGERACVVVGGDPRGAVAVYVDDARELDVPQLGKHEDVVLAHVARAHHARAQPLVRVRDHTRSLSGSGVTSPPSPAPRRGGPQTPCRAPAMNSESRTTGGNAGSSLRIRSSAFWGASPER